jgi:mono/diheme cytochrome c family protein
MVIVDGEATPAAELRTLVEEGRGKMPGWKKRLQPEEIEAVLVHVQQLEASASKR